MLGNDRRIFYLCLQTALIGVGVVFLYYLAFPPYTVDGHSMEPTLTDSSKMLTKNVNFFGREVERFEIAIIEHNDRTFVKRVVGLPEESVEIKDGKILINDKDITEEYSKLNKTAKEQLATVPDVERFIVATGCYFVLGDNLNYSMDSRNGLGLITKSEIVSKPFVTLYPKPGFIK